MTRYTDVEIPFHVEGVDINTVTNIHVTFKQETVVIDTVDPLTLVDGSGFIVMLSQDQTAAFRPGTVLVQLNFLDSIGKRQASDIAEIDISANLLMEVIDG